MTSESSWNPNPEWAEQQIEEYRKVRGRYELCARSLKRIMEQAVLRYAPCAIVQSRAKAVSSFAEKIHRPGKTCPDPVREFTDLCGVRVITHTQAEVEEICRFIEQHFVVDWENSVTVSQRLKPAEFGYRSVHYVIQLRPGVFPSRDIRRRIPDKALPDPNCPMKAEIQVRTLLEHAWAEFTHDRMYKGAFRVPDKLQRELYALAAMLEGTDNSFCRIEEGLKVFAASYGTLLKPEQMGLELRIQEFVLKYDPGNPEVRHRIARLAIELGDWQKAVDVLRPLAKSRRAPILRDLGIALCKLHRKETAHADFRKGQALLRRAIELNPRDTDALSSLAGAWKNVEDDPKAAPRARSRAHRLAREGYRQACEVDPGDPYPLGNLLEYEIADARSLKPARYMKRSIELALERCAKQANVGINLPWALYDTGKLQLLLNRPHESLHAYARAVRLSSRSGMVTSSLRSLEALSVKGPELDGYQWVRRMLLLGSAARFPNYESLSRVKEIASPEKPSPALPVVIVAGGCDPSMEQELARYRDLLLEAFRDFRGTLVSGGTTSGISGIVGELQERGPDRVHTLSYLPLTLPADAREDRRYQRVIRTDGVGFSPLEPLQCWADLMMAGVMPYQVKLVGINGGLISAAEYRIALALGAAVGIVAGSGREAGKLLPDEDWQSNFLVRLPDDPDALRGFLASGSNRLDPEVREAVARAIHENYRKTRGEKADPNDPAMADWDRLPDSLKDSNRLQADDIFAKLRMVGCEVAPAKRLPVPAFEFKEGENEFLAAAEHARWNVERFAAGWRPGKEKDVKQKVTPYLVDWSDLPEDIRDYDRQTVRKMPELLAGVGMRVCRSQK